MAFKTDSITLKNFANPTERLNSIGSPINGDLAVVDGNLEIYNGSWSAVDGSTTLNKLSTLTDVAVDPVTQHHVAVINHIEQMEFQFITIPNIHADSLLVAGQFADNDTTLMTSAAIQDKIEGYSYATASSTHAFTNKSGNISQWTNDSNYTNDADFASEGFMKRGASAGVYSIVADASTNWNTAHGWGNHASVGYLTNTILDEDDMATDSATALATQQSIKKYVDDTVASPSGNVTVAGDLTVNGTTTTINSATMTVDDPNVQLNAVSSPTDANADGGGFTLMGDTNKTIAWTNSTDRWHFNQGVEIDSGNLIVETGNVGIGTTNPGKTLEVKAGSSGNGINLIAHDSGVAYIQLESGSQGGYVQIHDNTNDQKVRLDSASASWFNGGNVGIGTTTPETLLHTANGAVKFEHSSNLSVDFESGDSTILKFVNNGVSESTIFRTNRYFKFDTGDTANSALVINASGNVGIGTISPSTALHIDSTDAVVIPVGITGQRPGSPANGMIRFNTTDNQYEGYGNSAWSNLGGSGGGILNAIKTSAVGSDLNISSSTSVYNVIVLNTADQGAYEFKIADVDQYADNARIKIMNASGYDLIIGKISSDEFRCNQFGLTSNQSTMTLAPSQQALILKNGDGSDGIWEFVISSI